MSRLNFSTPSFLHGNVGMVLKAGFLYGLKIVPLLKDGGLNDSFWQEAVSAFSYGAAIRFSKSFLKAPFVPMYWIRAQDKFYCEYKATHNENNPCFLLPFLKSQDCELNGNEELFEDYCFAPPELLQRIFEEKLPADILLVYFIEWGKTSLSHTIDHLLLSHKIGADGNRCGFAADHALSLVSQVLDAILTLHRYGLAHCDIKPGNIMVSKGLFRLTDFGSVHSENLPSQSGSKAFLHPNRDRIFKNRGLSLLDRRTLEDGYALAMTLYCIATKRQTPSSSPYSAPALISSTIIKQQWPGLVSDAFDILYDLWNLTIDKMESLLQRLKREAPDSFGYSEWHAVTLVLHNYYLPLFKTLQKGKKGLRYGHYYEQIRFNNAFDPLMKPNLHLAYHYEKLGFHGKMWDTMPTPLLNIVNNGRPATVIFHAPDDLRTGKRAVSFTDYIPYSLANASPTEQDQQEIMQMADIAAGELASNPDCMFWLPSQDHIVRIDGVWKVLWFAGRHVCPQEYDVRGYFQNLCHQAIERHKR